MEDGAEFSDQKPQARQRSIDDGPGECFFIDQFEDLPVRVQLDNNTVHERPGQESSMGFDNASNGDGTIKDKSLAFVDTKTDEQ